MTYFLHPQKKDVRHLHAIKKCLMFEQSLQIIAHIFKSLSVCTGLGVLDQKGR